MIATRLVPWQSTPCNCSCGQPGMARAPRASLGRVGSSSTGAGAAARLAATAVAAIRTNVASKRGWRMGSNSQPGAIQTDGADLDTDLIVRVRGAVQFQRLPIQAPVERFQCLQVVDDVQV